MLSWGIIPFKFFGAVLVAIITICSAGAFEIHIKDLLLDRASLYTLLVAGFGVVHVDNLDITIDCSPSRLNRESSLAVSVLRLSSFVQESGR